MNFDFEDGASFGEILDARLVSEAKLAKHIGVATATLYKWRRENRIPKEKWARKIEDILGLDEGYLDGLSEKGVKGFDDAPEGTRQGPVTLPDGRTAWYD